MLREDLGLVHLAEVLHSKPAVMPCQALCRLDLVIQRAPLSWAGLQTRVRLAGLMKSQVFTLQKCQLRVTNELMPTVC